MKHILLVIASLLFSVLFFEKSIGINLLIFSIITLIVLSVYHPQKAKQKENIVYSVVYLLSAIFVFIQDSSLSIFANCVAFFTLVGLFSDHKTSIYINWLNGVFTSIAGLLFIKVNHPEKKKHHQNIDLLHLTKLIVIPIVFVVIFILLYKNGNPLFEDMINKINFDFINIQWLLLTILGFYLFINISEPVQVEPATTKDLSLKNELFKSEKFSDEKLKKEKQLGTTLLSLLNLLIGFYLITDIISIQSLDISRASVLSAEVHKGINTLIASIIMAISIILYFFRGDLNFYKENRLLKYLTFLWIIFNVVLVALIFIKNQNYITAFGLTNKRIGVHIYISLVLIGLLTTFLKVVKTKNMVFLFRVNTQIAFCILIALSAINWDHTITNYNLNTAKSYDLNYLIELSDANAILLKEYSKQHTLDPKLNYKIDIKYADYLKKIEEKTWQELSFKEYKMSDTDKAL